MKTDIEIAQSCPLLPITAIGAKLGLTEEQLECYGRYKAKLLPSATAGKPQTGKLILVTAINPTAAGEGKTTTSIGLADSLSALGKKTVLALREPSLGPVFGLKGGATGGGWAQVAPMEDINLHFTGDFHAIGAANNLLAAMVDNHIYQGNALDIQQVTWRRCVDMNDRQLRYILCGLGGKGNGVPREEGFDITVATEVMAVLCLAEDLTDLKARLARMIVGYNGHGQPVTAGDLKAAGAMAALLKDAIRPNLAQSLEGTPAIIHGGPFANIAHGCNSVAATKAALRLGDYVVTEAGFGADLGAEKFLDIKCRRAGLRPDAVVIVATVRALKLHGGADKTQLATEDTAALRRGLPNLLRHIENITQVYGLPAVVALNRFTSDTAAELALVQGDRLVRYVPSPWPTGPVEFGRSLSPRVFLLKLTPGLSPDLIPDIFRLYDCVIVESFGVGGIPQRLMDAFAEGLGDYDKTHKVLILTTQVTYEGSDVGIYEVGKRVKNRFRFLEAHDMTIEAVVTKIMWLLAQDCDSFDQLQQRFYRQVNFDTFYH